MYGTGDEQESGLIGNKGWTSLQSFKQCSNFQQFFLPATLSPLGSRLLSQIQRRCSPSPLPKAMGNTQYVHM